MSNLEMYDRQLTTPLTDIQAAVEKLHQILNLAMVGAASTDTALRLPHLLDAQCTMHETIHRLAMETVLLIDGKEISTPSVAKYR